MGNSSTGKPFLDLIQRIKEDVSTNPDHTTPAGGGAIPALLDVPNNTGSRYITDAEYLGDLPSGFYSISDSPHMPSSGWFYLYVNRHNNNEGNVAAYRHELAVSLNFTLLYSKVVDAGLGPAFATWVPFVTPDSLAAMGNVTQRYNTLSHYQEHEWQAEDNVYRASVGSDFFIPRPSGLAPGRRATYIFELSVQNVEIEFADVFVETPGHFLSLDTSTYPFLVVNFITDGVNVYAC